jgi:cyanophycinase-like exopeptidase
MVQNSKRSPGTITFIGSGEMSPAMGKVHRAVLARVAGPAQAVFLDTPAGFELNADQISDRAIQYFKQHLNLDLAVVSFKSTATATPIRIENALRQLRQANYVFAGPGSPTYAIRNWRDTAILQAMARRLATGVHLVFASAAAIAIGRYALPVYEIYKVGEEPRWLDGLDLLGPYGLELAIVPHWNNNEGGTHDTRYCFIGESRMRLLERSLPDSAAILGIDENTACIVDLDEGACAVMGAGQVTIRRKGDETAFPTEAVFDLDQLKGTTPPKATEGTTTTSESLADWREWPDDLEDDTASEEPLIELLVYIRAQLRAAKQWALADEIRDRLAEQGILLEDSPTGTTWRRT